MKSIKLETLRDYLGSMSHGELLEWVNNQIAEEQAKKLQSGDMITIQIKKREQQKDGSFAYVNTPVLAIPLGKYFALHNPVADYATKGPKTITHIPSGHLILSKFKASRRNIQALIESLENVGLDWSLENPTASQDDLVQKARNLVVEFTKT